MLTLSDFSLILPEMIILLTAIFALLIDAFFKEAGDRLIFVCIKAGLMATILVLLTQLDLKSFLGFDGQVIEDKLAIILKITLCGVAFAAYTYSFYFNQQHKIPQGSYFTLSLLSILGAMVLCTAQNLLLVYMGLELVTLPMLALIALHRDEVGAEAAMKYFVMSALASGFFLYGISLCYGLTGSLDLFQMAHALSLMPLGVGILFAIVFLAIGVCFKLGIVPFHMWVPDAYQGAPTSVTILLASVSKLAAFALLFRIFVGGFAFLTEYWQLMLFAMATLSVVVGNIVALAQTNMKRLLAYSTISHMGFVVFGFAEGTGMGVSSALFYMVTYVISAVAAFGILMLLNQEGERPIDSIKDLSGLSKNHMGLAIMMSVVLFSMAGVPPFVGFDAKLFIIQSLVAKGHEGFALAALLMSVVGAYYYIRVIKVMFFEETAPEKQIAHKIPAGGACWLLSLNSVLLLILGLLPSTLLVISQKAVI